MLNKYFTSLKSKDKTHEVTQQKDNIIGAVEKVN